MMTWYHLALLLGYVTAGLLAYRVPRGLLWAAVSIVVLQASWVWWQIGLPHGAFFGGVLNLGVCFALYAVAAQKWEMRLWNCYHLMIVLDILYIAGIPTHFQFAIGLELANWLAIIVIGAAGVLERLGHGSPGVHPVGWLGYVRRSLYAPRSHPPFWKAP